MVSGVFFSVVSEHVNNQIKKAGYVQGEPWALIVQWRMLRRMKNIMDRTALYPQNISTEPQNIFFIDLFRFAELQTDTKDNFSPHQDGRKRNGQTLLWRHLQVSDGCEAQCCKIWWLQNSQLRKWKKKQPCSGFKLTTRYFSLALLTLTFEPG